MSLRGWVPCGSARGLQPGQGSSDAALMKHEPILCERRADGGDTTDEQVVAPIEDTPASFGGWQSVDDLVGRHH